MSKNSPPRWTEEQLQEWMNRRGQQTETQSPPSPAKKKKIKPESLSLEPGSKPKKRSLGIEVQPVINSINNSIVTIELDKDNGVLSILFEGAKLISLNDLFQIMQVRKYESFRYKKAWRNAINRALNKLGPQDWREVFPGKVKMTLFRRSAKPNDLDSARVLFKYSIDALVKHVYYLNNKRQRGVIIDDSRQYLPEMLEAYSMGLPAVGLRLERCTNEPEILMIEPEKDWFKKAAI